MLNKFICMGRIVEDLELKVTPSGVNVVVFTVAVERDYKGQNGEKQTDFLKVVAWRQTAEFIVNYFGKGRMICVEGSVQTRNYTDKDNNKRTATEVIAEKVFFTGESKKDTQSTVSTEPKADNSFSANDFVNIDVEADDGDLPF